MEEQITRTIIAPRIILKRNSKGLNWEIGSSSKDDLEEMKGIVENTEIIVEIIKEKFVKKNDKIK